MIWNSVPLMTAIDLLVIAVTIYGIWRCRLFIPSRRPSDSRIGVWLIGSGLLVLCLFYFADLVSMHALPTGFAQLLMELQEQQARVRRLVDSNIIGIFIWDPDGLIIDANEAFLRIVGYGHDDLVAARLRWRGLTPAEWRNADVRLVEELKATGTAQPSEKEYLHKSGSRVPVLVGAASFEGGGAVGFVIDLTDRKKGQQELLESERRHHDARMELAHANRVATLGQLSASIAHEVKQPIAATIIDAQTGLNWLDKNPPNLERVRQALGRIVTSANRASEVINGVCALVKKAPLPKDDFEINELVLAVVALTRTEVAKNGVSVQTHLARGLPRVQGDQVQLQQVILNLVINAVESLGGVGEGTRDLLIGTGSSEPGCVFVMVQDSGPGLPPAALERVFDAFYTTKPGGLGMGLSICRSIIEAHGGRLWATANLPRGAIFQFKLPADAGSTS
jgi:PAS domain S-box-containing protein